jgi:hypothetical protein
MNSEIVVIVKAIILISHIYFLKDYTGEHVPKYTQPQKRYLNL